MNASRNASDLRIGLIVVVVLALTLAAGLLSR